jgi:hypothetical protein
VLIPDRVHGRRCLCVACQTRSHPDRCECFWCSNRRALEEEYRAAEERAERAPVPSDAAARHVARLGLNRRQLAAELGVSLSTAQRVSTPTVSFLAGWSGGFSRFARADVAEEAVWLDRGGRGAALAN